jgi:hypothetical protein
VGERATTRCQLRASERESNDRKKRWKKKEKESGRRASYRRKAVPSRGFAATTREGAPSTTTNRALGLLPRLGREFHYCVIYTDCDLDTQVLRYLDASPWRRWAGHVTVHFTPQRGGEPQRFWPILDALEFYQVSHMRETMGMLMHRKEAG